MDGPYGALKEKNMLEIKGLKVDLEDEDKSILKGVDLSVPAGEVHAIMGPNGSGKSTLSYVLSGKDGYEVKGGTATLNGVDLLAMEPEERAAAGLFLAFQYPVEIPGVGNMTFLRTAVNAQRKARGEEELSAGEFLKEVRAKAKDLKIDAEMLKRPVNVGFSGGEKKRNEILQMAMLEPKMCILDETDSGLDVDAMKLVADGACWTTSNQTSCTSCRTAVSSRLAGQSLPLRSNTTVTPICWRRTHNGACATQTGRDRCASGGGDAAGRPGLADEGAKGGAGACVHDGPARAA
jgi:Fe-S cluster assembly ATP-binding protein